MKGVVNPRRRGTYVPRFETLENRDQPGSILSAGPDLALLGAGLDAGSLGNNPNPAGSPFHSHALDLDLASLTKAHGAGTGSPAGAPAQAYRTQTVATSSLPLNAGGNSLDSLGTDQGLAAAAAHRFTAQAPVAPRGQTVNAVPNGGQGAAPLVNSGQATVAPAPLAAPQPVAQSAALVGQPNLQALSDAQGTTQGGQSPDGGGGAPPPLSGLWASYLGGPGADALYKVAEIDPGTGPTLYTVGWTTDQSDGQTLQLLVARIPDGATDPNQVVQYVSPSNPGFNAQGLAIDLATDGSGNLTSVIVGGYVTAADGATPNLVVESLSPDLQTVNWAVTSSDPSVVNGVKVSGGFVYFTGNDSGNLLVGRLDLGSGTADATYGGIFGFTDANGNALPSNGTALGVDANTGNADVAMIITDANGNDLPSFGQVTADGSSIAAFSFGSTGPGGALNAVTVDANGNAYYAGTTFSTGTQYDGFSYLIITEVAPDGQTLLYTNPQTGQGVAWLWFLQNQQGQHAFNWVANDNKVDANGNAVMATTFDDGMNTSSSFGQEVFKVGPNGDAVLDSGDGGVNGSQNDIAFGIAIDATNRIWEVGMTSSPDFTTNGFQTVYGGDPSDGWIAGFTSP